MKIVLQWFVLLLTAVGLAQSGPVEVGDPVVPTLTPAVRDLPDFIPDPDAFRQEPIRRNPQGLIGPGLDMPPHDNPLVELQSQAPGPEPNAFGTPVVNFAGVTSTSPPDNTGDVGPTYFLQADNGPGGSRITIFNKSGTQVKQFLMETLGSTPCSSGYCDPIVQYDELADRWMISEFEWSGGRTLCVYISQTGDPLGAWYAYQFYRGSLQDYPKYAVWPDGYYVAANNGGTVMVLERPKMLLGQPATIQTFSIGTLSGFGFQLTVPGTLEGPAPPAGSPALFLRPRDTEIHGGTCTGCDLMEMWTLKVDWVTPANSRLTALSGVQMTDWDHTLCGTGSTWNCMPQPGTTQKLDPIREPIHYPLQYRNFGAHETLVGCFAQDVDGTDHAAVHWFEIRRTPPGTGNWVKHQEGVLGGEANVHRSVCSAAMDGSGNIAVFYTRTGTAAPYYPSIYYSGRLSTDPAGTMPYYDNKIQDAITSQTGTERWGDYAGGGVDPSDDCTIWFTTEYGGSSQTRVAAVRFDQCGTCTAPIAPTLTAADGNCAGATLNWSAGSGATNAYNVYRAAACGGAYTKIAGPLTGTTTYTDATGAPGTSYGYMIRGACDASGNTESGDSNCLSATRLASPTPTITGGAANVCPAVTVDLTTESGRSNYQWYRNGSPVGTDSNAYTATQSGDYTVSYTAANGCGGTSAIKTVTITPCAPVIVHQSHTAPQEMDGDMDGVMEAGERWRMTVTVANAGNVPAVSVLGSLGGQGLTVCNNPGTFGGVVVSGTADYAFDFIPDPASWYGTNPCGNPIGFDLVGKSSDGGTYLYADDPDFASRAVGTPGSAVTLFGPDDIADIANWSSTGGSLLTEGKCPAGSPVPSNAYYRINQNQSITLTNAVSTVGYTDIRVLFHGAVQAAGATLYLDWSPDGTTWNNAAWSTTSTTWSCGENVALPAGAAGQAGFKIRFRNVGGTATQRGKVDTVAIQGTAPGNCGTWAASCAGAPPGEVLNARWSSKTTLTWDPNPTATLGYRVYRGLPGDLPYLLNSTMDSCLRASTGSFSLNSVDLAADDPSGVPGGFYWYLIHGENPAGQGTVGNGSSGPRILDPGAPCP